MIHDLLTADPQSVNRAEIAIVGAGAAGIALAIELAASGKDVLLLEGGGANFEEDSQSPYRSETLGLPHRGIHTGRFRVKGGTTTMWGGQILELDDTDFQHRPWVRGSGWPIHKSELTPYYSRALKIEGVDSSILNDGDVWKALREPPPKFHNLESYLSRWCPEPNFARLHRRGLEQDSRIQVWLHANAVELLFENQNAVGVRCKTLGNTESIFYARQFVFALGAIESSRFFLQPRSTGSLPWNQSDLLGSHFQDHIDSTAAIVRPISLPAFHREFDTIFLRGHKYNPKLRLSWNAQQQAQVLNVGATMFSVSSADEILTDLKMTAKHILRGRFDELSSSSLLKMLRHSPLLVRQVYRFAFEHRSYTPASSKIKLRVHCEQEPDSASTITLSDERDVLGLLRTRLTWRISPAELRTIRRFVEIVQSSLRHVAEIIPDPDLFAEDERFIAHCEDSFHHMGGMRMSSSRSSGVVDTDLKLYGTDNVFICSSAVFPTSGFSNPTHTLLALAARLADHLTHRT